MRLRVKKSTPRLVIKRGRAEEKFFHAHAHSHYSVKDALPEVKAMVATVAAHGQRALALTDHGNMSGAVDLYQSATKAGIKPFPGVEAYIVPDKHDKEAKRHHVGLLALDEQGYKALAALSTRSFKRDTGNFHHKPRIDWTDLAEWAERGWTDHLALTTGCYFSLTIQALVQRGAREAEGIIRQYARLFPHTFVEVQQHNTEHDDEWSDGQITDVLLDIAERNGLPAIATNDAHYCDLADVPVHDGMKRLISWGPDGDDAVFPGDGYHLCEQAWVQNHLTVGQWRQVEGSYDHLYDLNTLVIPPLEDYRYRVPVKDEDPDATLAAECLRALDQIKRARGHSEDDYLDRFEAELDVIKHAGFSGYLLLCRDVIKWCDDHNVFTQIRGSASGSLVCYLLGITQLDPLEYGLLFERFLSRDRTKPPDIDIDVEDESRDLLIDYLRARYDVTQIGTYSTMGLNEDGTGSLVVAWNARRKRDGHDEEYLPVVQAIERKHPDDADLLHRLSDAGPFASYGTHAAGLVVTDARSPMSDYVPTMLVASSDTEVTQFTMDQVEALGYVKLDILGLRTLSALRRAMSIIGMSLDDIDSIPLNDGPTFTLIRKGATKGIFQLEGGTMRRGVREMKVRTLDDVVAALALYRPATMKSGLTDTYNRRRFGAEDVEYDHDIFEECFGETLGVPVFQEQVVSLLRGMGFDAEALTAMLKAVKASNSNIGSAGSVLAGYKDEFRDRARDHDFTPRAETWAWNAVLGFAEYGFNKAHATSYGITAVRMSWLKRHEPLAFFTALLATNSDAKREKEYVREARKFGQRILPPDVNISGAVWTVDKERDAIRRGLSSIKGIGSKAAEELEKHAPYTDVQDLIDRTDNRAVTGGKDWPNSLNGVVGKLADAGALKTLGVADADLDG